jgi:hypothetical protein
LATAGGGLLAMLVVGCPALATEAVMAHPAAESDTAEQTQSLDSLLGRLAHVHGFALELPATFEGAAYASFVNLPRDVEPLLARLLRNVDHVIVRSDNGKIEKVIVLASMVGNRPRLQDDGKKAAADAALHAADGLFGSP